MWTALIWFGFGLVDATQTVLVMRSEGMHHPWGRLFTTTLFSLLPWALATPVVMWLARRFPPAQPRSMTWLVHVGGCAAMGLLYAAWAAALEVFFNPYGYASGPGSFLHLLSDKFDNGVLASVVLYTAVLAVSSSLSSRARLAHQQTETARLNEQLSKAQLDALRRQIEPHFLFNALNSISGLVREGREEAAVSMIAELSDFMRRVLQDSSRQEVPLAEEMHFAQRYLEIQKVRFVERLQLSVDIPDELMHAQVPSLILQPIVENAIKHGIAKRVQGGSIRIVAFRANERLTLRVSNDGPRLPERPKDISPGIGIASMRTRLQSLYGDAFELSLHNLDAGGVEASVSVPFKE